MNYKKNVENAISNFLKKQEPKQNSSQKNQKPEKEVEALVQSRLKELGFFSFVVESKAVFSPEAGRFLGSRVKAGTADILAVSPSGLFCALELKAPGRASTLRDNQRQFLLNAIDKNAFACVVDSVERFDYLWKTFNDLPLRFRKELLINALPKKRAPKDKEELFKME
jgi:hypothetical protein